ncbi:hypothetical protein MPRM_53880 [Mycobacterium parmense]|uniref:Uncharacterized protein n=1 Tax=Mycobacterium parmense TaxID=185642 RepID=A0A7I7Z3D2_9MYCO|nr:hypothetical protein MPRM_53880 [Mycobacterium parmense]
MALAWAVEPLAFNVFWPPQFTGTGSGVVVELFALLEFLSLPHPDRTMATLARMLSEAPNRLSLNPVPNRFRGQ